MVPTPSRGVAAWSRYGGCVPGPADWLPGIAAPGRHGGCLAPKAPKMAGTGLG
jgi:hypothetical protein